MENWVGWVFFVGLLVEDHGYLFLVLPVLSVILVYLLGRRIRNLQRERLFKLTGLTGKVIYADSGRYSRVFRNRSYGVLAKPDFVVRLDTGEYCIVEYKSRTNNRLYASDTAQVKASALAVRSKHFVTKAYVLAGTKMHEIDVSGSNRKIQSDIKKELDYARQVAKGKVITKFAIKKQSCVTCQYKYNCKIRASSF